MQTTFLSTIGLFGLATALSATPISIFNTGAAGSGSDTHYTVSELGYFTSPTSSAKIINHTNSSWAAPLGGSNWINATGSGSSNSCGGCYFAFTTTFDLTGLNPLTAVLEGSVMADDHVAIYLNNTWVSTYFGGYNHPTSFTIGSDHNSSFVNGLNSLSFVVQNDGGPMGLDAVLHGTAASAVPEPGAFGLMAAAGIVLVSLGSFGRSSVRKGGAEESKKSD